MAAIKYSQNECGLDWNPSQLKWILWHGIMQGTQNATIGNVWVQVQTCGPNTQPLIKEFSLCDLMPASLQLFVNKCWHKLPRGGTDHGLFYRDKEIKLKCFHSVSKVHKYVSVGRRHLLHSTVVRSRASPSAWRTSCRPPNWLTRI